jgi:hypothetical protein
MAVPVINAVINFSTGPGFAQAMILGEGQLDVNALGDAASVIVDVSDQVNAISTRRGRNAQADQFQTGELSLRIVDQNGDFNPQNTASPYYGLLNPMRKVIITATYSSVTYPIFAGFITSYITTTPKSIGDVVYTTITAVDAFRLAQNAQISTVTGATAGQYSGTRINKILDQIGWPASMRDVDTGLTTMQIDPGTPRTALEAMQKVELSEYGSLYVSASGSFVFQDRAFTTGSFSGTPIAFNDNGTEIPYFNAVWILNDVLVYNSAQVTRTGGTTQTASNAASIAKYFIHSYNQQDLLMETDAVALQYAQAYVASRAETTVRCDAVTLDLYTANYDAGILAALNLDFFDPVTVTTTQPAVSGISTLSKTFQVFGVAHQITPNSWKTEFTTLEPIIDGFILNSTLSGILDTSVLSY